MAGFAILVVVTTHLKVFTIKASKIEELANYLDTGCTDKTTALLGIEETKVYQPLRIEKITFSIAILNILLAFGVMAMTFV